MVNICELLTTAVRMNKPKMLTGLDQNGNVVRNACSVFMHRKQQQATGGQVEPNPLRRSPTYNMVSPDVSPRGEGES